MEDLGFPVASEFASKKRRAPVSVLSVIDCALSVIRGKLFVMLMLAITIFFAPPSAYHRAALAFVFPAPAARIALPDSLFATVACFLVGYP